MVHLILAKSAEIDSLSANAYKAKVVEFCWQGVENSVSSAIDLHLYLKRHFSAYVFRVFCWWQPADWFPRV